MEKSIKIILPSLTGLIESLKNVTEITNEDEQKISDLTKSLLSQAKIFEANPSDPEEHKMLSSVSRSLIDSIRDLLGVEVVCDV